MNCFNEMPPPTHSLQAARRRKETLAKARKRRKRRAPKEGRGAYEDEILNNFPKFLSEQGNKKSPTHRSEWSLEMRLQQ